MLKSTRNSSEGGEFVAGDFGMCAPDHQLMPIAADVRHTSIWTSAWISPTPSAMLRRLRDCELTTDGKPTKPTLAIPVLATSKPRPGPPPPPPPGGAINSRRNLASLAARSALVLLALQSPREHTFQLPQMVVGGLVFLDASVL